MELQRIARDPGFVCPSCRHEDAHGQARVWPIVVVSGRLLCTNRLCGASYPIVQDIPVLVPNASAFVEAERGWLDGTASPTPGRGDVFAAAFLNQAKPGAAGTEPGLEPLLDWQRSLAALLQNDIAELPVADGPGSSVGLDVGCGVGQAARWLACRDDIEACVALDLRFEVLGPAQRWVTGGGLAHLSLDAFGAPRRHMIPAPAASVLPILADAADPPFAPQSFAAMVALNVIDVTQQPLRVIRQMHDLLRPGGGLLLTTPFAFERVSEGPGAWPDRHEAPLSVLDRVLTGEHSDAPDVAFEIVKASDDHAWPVRRADRRWSIYRVARRVLRRLR